MTTYKPSLSGRPSLDALLAAKVASRIRAKDFHLYDFDEEASRCASEYMGWTDLAQNPPYPLDAIADFADEVLSAGIDTVILTAEGGSVQAPMTMASYHEPEGNRVRFIALDSDAAAEFHHLMAGIDPARTLCLVSSKSGGTIEPNVLSSVLWREFSRLLPADQVGAHFAAITDPGSSLEEKAQTQGWRAAFHGEPTVGGRFSALSVFGLVPAALIGLDLEHLIEEAAVIEQRCGQDVSDNPAIQLAAFLNGCRLTGRDKFSLVTPYRARELGLWVEQLIAESTGKQGKGVLPNTEGDVDLLAVDRADRCVITCSDVQFETPESAAFMAGLARIAPETPRFDLVLEDTYDLVGLFVVWEYATAMLGWLMEVSPFDQPDVASSKARTLDILADGLPRPDFVEEAPFGSVAVKRARSLESPDTLADTLRALFASAGAGDYLSLNAFLPECDGRAAVLGDIRHDIAQATGAVTCLAIGPRYLHSVGQLHKGGPNTGVFLVVSADDEHDVPVKGQKTPSLATLARAQAAGDYAILNERNRRCVQVHLPRNDAASLEWLAGCVHEALGA